MNVSYLRKIYKYRKFFLSLGNASQIYTIGWFFLIVSIPFAFTRIINFEFSRIGVSVCFLLFILFVTVDFFKDIIDFGVNLWKSKFGKFIIGLVTTIVIQIAYILAGHEVNLITGLPPNSFDTSVTLLAVIASPFILLVIFFGAILIFIIAYSLILGASSIGRTSIILKVRKSLAFRYIFRQKIKNKPEILIPSRMLGAYISILLIIIMLTFYGNINESLNSLKKDLIANIDYFSKSYCKNVIYGERFLPLKGKLISVAKYRDEQWIFESRECIY